MVEPERDTEKKSERERERGNNEKFGKKGERERERGERVKEREILELYVLPTVLVVF